MYDELSRAASVAETPPASPEALERARALLREAAVEEARRFLEAQDERVLAEQRELTEIPAPPFGEAARAARMAELMADAGLHHVEPDGEGNVLGWLRPPRPTDGEDAPPLIVSAHLDTVFPAETDVTVRVKGDRLVGPGISDDGRGLAALLGLARALVRTPEVLSRPLLFAATVGEEGAGDLRGVRHLFREGGEGRRASAFLSLDGAGMNRIVSSGLGSRRFRVAVEGPGGHSWVNWGTPNPIHALAASVTRWTRLPPPRSPRPRSRWRAGAVGRASTRSPRRPGSSSSCAARPRPC